MESEQRRSDETGRPDGNERLIERSAGGVVVRQSGGSTKVLLIRDPYRKWGLPKGHLEDGEGAEEAAMREVREETGLESLVLSADLGEIDWTFRKAGRLVHKYCRFYLMESAEGEARPDTSEGITECRWLTVDQAVETISYENARAILLRGVERMTQPDPRSSDAGGG